MFPKERPRRLRRTSALRDMVRETHVRADDLIAPYFVDETADDPIPLQAMPGQYRHSLKSLARAAEEAAKAGIKALILFGIPAEKDPLGKQAYAKDGIVQQAVRSLKELDLPLEIITDVCLCEFTSHGHCGALRDQEVDNDATLDLLAQTAVSQARAGADIVAPSDMMDGRVSAIRHALDQNGFEHLPILSYAVKYASGFYGPFREAADSTPEFGDRSGYQMDPANSREALKEARADIEEGADMIMVKPALAYLDVIRAVKEATNVPVAAYSVSGEYSMIEFAAMAGALDRERIIRETLLSIKRAGADLILTYHAVEAARWFNNTV